MAILRPIFPLLETLLGGIFCILLYSCNGNNNHYSNDIKVDTFHSDFDVENVFEYSWVNGMNFINIADTPYLCMFKTRDTLILANLSNKSRNIDIPVPGEVNALWVKGNKISYILEEELSKVHFINVDTNKFSSYTVGEYSIPKIFNDSFFISSIYLSRIEPLQENDIFIPYRIRNGSPNLLDTFSYIWLKQTGDTSYSISKKIKTPVELLQNYEYLRFPICAFDKNSNTLYYAFHKIDTLFSLSLENGKKNGVKIDGLEIKKFTGKQRDLTYLRKYLKASDKIDRIMVDPQSNIYLFIAKKEGAEIKSEIIVFDNKLKEIARHGLKAKLDATVAFMKNNKIFVYEASSNNRFFVFTLIASQLSK